MLPVSKSGISLRIFFRRLILLGMTIFCLTACQKEKDDFGSGQRAHRKDITLQNKILLEQFVISTEELENHPDPAYLDNSLARLNPWLTTCEPSRDFRLSEEYQAKETLFKSLSETAGKIDALYQKTVSQGASDNNIPKENVAETTLTEDEANQLMVALDDFLVKIKEVKETYRSRLFAQYETMATDLKSKLEEAQKFQFGNKGKMVTTALAHFTFVPSSFKTLSNGADSIARLYRLDARSFNPEDSHHFKETVWERNIVLWAKGDRSDATSQALSLFNWTCDSIPLKVKSEDAPRESMAQIPWQTLLTSQGNGSERAVVFMGLLRQLGITSFLIRPVSLAPEKLDEFPLMVGVVLPTEDGQATSTVRLFLPEWGIPIPGADSPTVSTEENGRKGLVFHSIASLADVAGDDALLRRLDLPDAPFPATAADLKEVRALLPTNFFNMSERMWIMMRESVIERKDVDGIDSSRQSFIPPILAVSFDSLQAEISSLPNITVVEHGWEFQTAVLEQTILPIESQFLTLPYLYNVEAGENLSMRADTESSEKIAPTEGTGSGPDVTARMESKLICPLWEGKILYFKGDFEKENGAANRLQQGRISDRLLKQASHDLGGNLIEYVTQIQKDQRGKGNELTEDQLKALAAQFMTQGRQDIGMKIFLKVTARFYLGLISHALGNDTAAVNHLEDADLLTKLDGLWKLGTLNLLAEIYENRGDFQRAETIYDRLDGPAALGGKLRAKWLREATSGSEKP